MQETVVTKLITILAGALAGFIASFWNTRLQDWLKRRALHQKLTLRIADHHHSKVAVRICNGHVLPMTNCWAYITLVYDLKDIVPPPNGWGAHITPELPLHLTEDRLCWSVQSPVPCPPVVDIYAKEYQSLEVFCFDPNKKWLGIFSETRGEPYRVFLHGDKPYDGFLRIVSKDTVAKTFNINIDLQRSQSPLVLRD